MSDKFNVFLSNVEAVKQGILKSNDNMSHYLNMLNYDVSSVFTVSNVSVEEDSAIFLWVIVEV